MICHRMAENPHQGEVLQKLNAIQDALYFGMGLELHASGLLGGMEIGRASCRERV